MMRLEVNLSPRYDGPVMKTRFETTLDPEVLDWYRTSPARRFEESLRLWANFRALGGSLDPEPDSQSPFDAFYRRRPRPVDGRTGVHPVRRGGVQPGRGRRGRG